MYIPILDLVSMVWSGHRRKGLGSDFLVRREESALLRRPTHEQQESDSPEIVSWEFLPVEMHRDLRPGYWTLDYLVDRSRRQAGSCAPCSGSR